MKHRTLYSVLAVFVLASMILVACQPAATPTEVVTEAPMETEPPTEPPPPTEAPPPTEVPTEAPTEEPMVEGGTLIFVQSADAGTLDPALETSANSLAPASHIYEGLTQFEPGTTTPIPALATSWEASEASPSTTELPLTLTQWSSTSSAGGTRKILITWGRINSSIGTTCSRASRVTKEVSWPALKRSMI